MTTALKLSPFHRVKAFLIGKPLPSYEMAHQTISKKVGLAVFASDALSSTAYATDEILFVLILAGVGAFTYVLPIAISIAILLAIVTISYEQTIHAYPNGGGAYIVSRDNLGEIPAQIAGAALLTDYILTVAVSISSGVAQITSAFPALYDWRIPIALALVCFMTLINLRGVKESGIAFAVPTYFFLAMTIGTIGFGFFRYFTGALGTVPVAETAHGAFESLSLFLILRAFSSGCTALTGVEAISNGIPAFKEPKSRNAGITLFWMSAILMAMFLSISFLARQIQAVPSHEETIFSQIGRVLYGSGSPLYLALLGGTTLILIMAANTSFADFPRLSAIQAHDGFLPKQLTYRGSRLVYTYGIAALAGFAGLLIIIFGAQTNALIPLYAIGVFLSFTLSQTGMAVRWWRTRKLKPGEELHRIASTLHFDKRWWIKMLINGFGAVCTFVVMIVFAVTKFTSGAWVVVIIIPVLVFIFLGINNHYRDLARKLSLEDYGAPPRVTRNRVLLLIGGVHRGILHALRYTRSLSQDITAVFVATDQAEEEKIKQKWAAWGDGIRLRIIPSPYRRLIEPILEHIDKMAEDLQPQEMLTIVVPHFVPSNPLQNALHMNTAMFLRQALLDRPNIVVMEVPYHLRERMED